MGSQASSACNVIISARPDNQVAEAGEQGGEEHDLEAVERLAALMRIARMIRNGTATMSSASAEDGRAPSA
jgi:hypothetical protein